MRRKMAVDGVRPEQESAHHRLLVLLVTAVPIFIVADAMYRHRHPFVSILGLYLLFEVAERVRRLRTGSAECTRPAALEAPAALSADHARSERPAPCVPAAAPTAPARGAARLRQCMPRPAAGRARPQRQAVVANYAA